ncbi:MAG: hypothetical protein AB7V16_09690 [Vulcanibacillus sp.]
MYHLKYVSKGMLASLSLAIIIAYMISLIPNSQVFTMYQDLTVFNHTKPIELNEKNIVGFISPYSDDMQIKRVTWEQNVLSIDFYIDRTSNIDTLDIYKDLFTVIQKSFIECVNIKEVLIRVYINDLDKIFVAVVAQKKDIANNPEMEIKPNMMYKDFLEEYFGLNYGNLLRQY